MIVLGEPPSLANQFLNEIRGKDSQQDRLRFRRNLERMGEIMAYEISKRLSYKACLVTSPLASIKSRELISQPILVTVLRAGLPYFQGFLNYFDQADAGFIGAYRKEDGEELTINLEYLASPMVEGQEVILIDPMLATGKSFIRSINALLSHGKPAHIHLASLIASPEGIQHIKENLKIPFTIWTFSVDEKLDNRFYIVPGLGDAGDMSFGTKL
ncbi:MAG: uracil phosphoribosyltransferase [Cyclobacteriaceae bacterium]|nr:uracil phosphoribosyltransferase [Cyclobacteriaceae bacterium]